METWNKSSGLAGLAFSSWFNSSPWSTYILPVLVIYPVVCSTLRYQRITSAQRKYKYGTALHPSYAGMTGQEAFEILKLTNEYEFPTLFEKALGFALFRTYGIPSISALLTKTTQLSDPKTVGKRYADTAVLIAEIYGNAPSSERGIESFARLNYLHSHYIRQRLITNDDMLYTLSLFATQPLEWINRYEWRQVTELETCAIGVFHKSMGDAMEIDFSPLGSQHWEDGLQFYRALDGWSKAYEKQFMVPDPRNFATAVQTRDLMMKTTPKFTHGLLGHLISAVMDDRLREAIMFREPLPVYRYILNGAMALRRWCLRYLALPRTTWGTERFVTDEVDGSGRRHLSRYDTLPTYVKPTLWNRWGPTAWISRLIGVPLPGDDDMYPEGFLVKDVGPKTFTGKGWAEAEKTKEKLRKERTGACPFLVTR